MSKKLRISRKDVFAETFLRFDQMTP